MSFSAMFTNKSTTPVGVTITVKSESDAKALQVIADSFTSDDLQMMLRALQSPFKSMVVSELRNKLSSL